MNNHTFLKLLLLILFKESKEWWASLSVYAQIAFKFRSRRVCYCHWLINNISFFRDFNSKLTSLIKLRETTKASWLECALSIFQARYAACPPLGGNRRVSISELCVLSAFLFYARPDVNRSLMMKHQQRHHRPTHLSHCRQITIDILIIMLVPIWKHLHWWTVVVV